VRATDILTMQLQGSCDLIVDHAQTASAQWTSRAFDTASLPGFMLWHAARVLDWGVNAVVRRDAEVAMAGEWRERVRFDLGHGAGLTEEQADLAARSVSAADGGGYARALRRGIDAWLSGVGDADLDTLLALMKTGAAPA
jgi:hypothetical protein